MASRYLSDLVGTLKTAFRIGKATINTSGTGTAGTVLHTTNSGIALNDTNGLSWNSQLTLQLHRISTDLLQFFGTSGTSGLKIGTGAGASNYIESGLQTIAGARIAFDLGSVSAPNYSFCANNKQTGLFLKQPTAGGPTILGFSAQEASSTTGQHAADFQLGQTTIFKGTADTVSPFLTLDKSRGTTTVPTVITTGDAIGAISGRGYVGSNGYIEAARIEFISTGTITNATNGIGGELAISTRTAAGSLTEKVRLSHAGALKARVFQPTVQTVSFSATPSINVSLGDTVDMTLTGNVTSATLTGGVDGQKVTLRIRQDGTGSRTFTFDSSARFGTDITSITLSTAAGKLDYIGLIYSAADSKYDVVAFTKGF